MTAVWPRGLHAVSRAPAPSHLFVLGNIEHSVGFRRHYASANPNVAGPAKSATQYASNAAFAAIETRAGFHPVNPPLSTLPPPLKLPERAQTSSTLIYWFRVGQAYGTFYKEGIKAVWYNWKAARLLRDRLEKEAKVKDAVEAAARGVLTRSEWQLLQRNAHDIGKLPLFGVLVILLGEWLPLLVPFIPGVVPGTCQIPSQVRGMRDKAEERRRISFRQGIVEPSKEQMVDARTEEPAESWAMMSEESVRALLSRLRDDQLLHLSATLSLHSRLWDRIQLPPPTMLLRRCLRKHLHYLAIDDALLVRSRRVAELTAAEVERACEERGLDVLGRREALLRDNLAWWLKRQEEDKGQGRAMMAMLFRRLAMHDWVKLNMEANRSQAQ